MIFVFSCLFLSLIRPPPILKLTDTLFPYTTLFRSHSAATGIAARPRCPGRRRQPETLEAEGRRHGAAAERPGAETLRRLPGLCRDHRLWPLAAGDIGPHPVICRGAAVRRDHEAQRRAGIPVPCPRRAHPLPVPAPASHHQEEERRRSPATARAAP